MSDAEMNEFCARELGWNLVYHEHLGVKCLHWIQPGFTEILPPCHNAMDKAAATWRYLPDFLTSESANAMLLEAMHLPTLDRRLDGWHCHAYALPAKPEWHVIDKDRKRAIVLAFIEWRKHV